VGIVARPIRSENDRKEAGVRKSLVAAICVSTLRSSYIALAQENPAPHPSMNFFVNSAPIGDGGNLVAHWQAHA
jgi:hypothetical protein